VFQAVAQMADDQTRRSAVFRVLCQVAWHYLAAPSTLEPTFCTSLPKPCIVLQPDKNSAAMDRANSVFILFSVVT
jgi:hypothetical protein